MKFKINVGSIIEHSYSKTNSSISEFQKKVQLLGFLHDIFLRLKALQNGKAFAKANFSLHCKT